MAEQTERDEALNVIAAHRECAIDLLSAALEIPEFHQVFLDRVRAEADTQRGLATAAKRRAEIDPMWRKVNENEVKWRTTNAGLLDQAADTIEGGAS